MAQKKTEQMGSGDRFKASVRSGDAFAGKGEWEKAISHYIEALSFDEKAKDVHEKLLKMYLNKGDKKGYTEALARLNAVKSGKPLPEQKTISEKNTPSKFQELELIEEPIQPKAEEDIIEDVKEDTYSVNATVTQKVPEALVEEELPEVQIQEDLHEQQQEDLPQELILEEQHDLQQGVIKEQEISQELIQEQLEPAIKEVPQILLKKQLQDNPAQEQLQNEPEAIIQNTQQENMQHDLLQEDVSEQVLHESPSAALQEASKKLIVEADKDIAEKIEVNNVSVSKKSFSSPSDEAQVLEETLLREPDNLEVLEQLNQLYTKGVKLSDSAVVAIYRKIYRMKI